MSDASIEEIVDFMYNTVKESQGKKKLKPRDVQKAAEANFGCDRAAAKQALRQLIDTGRCVYSYFGGSFVEIPPEKGVDK
jgi:hypothetical protein